VAESGIDKLQSESKQLPVDQLKPTSSIVFAVLLTDLNVVLVLVAVSDARSAAHGYRAPDIQI